MMGSFSIAETGVITYSKKGGDGKPIFQCHPVEKPFRKLSLPQPISSRQRDDVELIFFDGLPPAVIFQIGSSDPESAVKAAKVVQQDVAGL